jgi:hypothetical protein
MESTKKIVISIFIVFCSLQVFSQHFYDSSGHLLAYQKGVVLYNALNKKIGHIWPDGFKDTLGNVIVSGGYFTVIYGRKYRDTVGCEGVYNQGSYIYSSPMRRIIGRIEGCDITDAVGNKIGYTDKDVPESEAIVFYFLLLPFFEK